jgi:hypothetical protein
MTAMPLDFNNLNFHSYTNLTPNNIIALDNLDNLLKLGVKLVELRNLFILPSTYLMATIAAKALQMNYLDNSQLFPKQYSANWRSKLINLGKLLLQKPFLYRHLILSNHAARDAVHEMKTWNTVEDEDHLTQICQLCNPKT